MSIYNNLKNFNIKNNVTCINKNNVVQAILRLNLMY